ncbi:uncharacterized protein LAESUDRAFT_668604 [Laetiporus sulphureus 93-53]|uniref:Ubiquitin-like-conjugating enzyme ATG10 n=1 Tax=Laetiporus sulphureus 93-53 TaxID=1314785 RepID=A0A165I8C4_9APHY|nr:uncharacterized protein LAESUDRAFT_668604 [Laetiporus sulphureus 93-53]KZT12721.1 hypothetical protein LAESUDRAFT_668604 [Laetiporus sulphureus 93-53]
MAATLTRLQFETACKAYIDKHNARTHGDLSLQAVHPDSWTWHEHALAPHLGYMSRSVLISVNAEPRSSHEDDEGWLEAPETVDDVAVFSESDIVTARQSVVYSATFQVPAFYFTMHHSNGTPLTLMEIVSSPLLRSSSILGTETTSFAVSDPGSNFPLLSQGEHPVLGTPSWYLHPCHTAEAVEEIMLEVESVGLAEESRLQRCIEAWFTVLGQMVDLAPGSVP